MIVSVADRLKNVQEYYFSKKLEQIQQMRNRGIDVISLGIGSPDQIPPPEAIQAASAAIAAPNQHGYASYRSLPELRAAISNWYSETFSVKLDPSTEILPLLGSKEGILYLSMAILNPGDSVLVPNPGYPAYASVAELLGVNVIYYDLTAEQNWLPHLEVLQKLNLDRCKLMWVNYPHMPTGQSCPPEFFAKLVAFGKKNKMVICNDNPYGLVLNETKPQSILSEDPKFEVACELNSLSKSFNMAGWRVGMFLGATDLVDAVLRVKSNVDSGMFLPVQKGAIEALKVNSRWHDERNSVYRRRRELVWKIFDLLKFEYTKDQVGLFVWARVPDHIPNVAEYLDGVLDQAHVFLTPGMIFGSNGNRYARGSLCASEKFLLEAVERIRKFAQATGVSA
jgi:LL-diaminopimelate aminotransferase